MRLITAVYTALFSIFFITFISLKFCIAAGDFGVTLKTSRISGVAPVSVFFDITSTPALSNGSYVAATVAWNFDTTDVDTNANYRTGSGFVAAHVFENPGAYTVRVDIYAEDGRHAWETVTVAFSDFTGATYYVATDGDDGNPGTIDEPFETVNYALCGPHVGPNTRILFRNGDTFYMPGMITVTNKTGPIIISGYSDPGQPSSVNPVMYITAVDGPWATINFSDCSDIRIKDIAARATAESSENPRYPSGITWDYACTHMLKYRTEEYQNGGMAMSPCGQYNTIAECSFHNTTQTGYCSSSGTNTDNAIIGNNVYDKNLIDPLNEEHVFRLQGGSSYYIAHNTFGPNARVNYDILTIRGDSDKVVIYDNTIYDYVTAIWPQNRDSAEEYQHHCIIDSNQFIGSTNNTIAIALHSKDIVIRNNIIYNYNYGIGIGDDTVVGPTQRVTINHNTMINPTSNSGYVFAYVDNNCFDIDFFNNLMLDTSGSLVSTRFLQLRNHNLLNGNSDNNLVYSTGNDWTSWPLFDGLNLADWQSFSNKDGNTAIEDPALISTNLSSVDFCRPFGNSPAVNAGKFTGTALDYYGNKRGPSRDIGAVEYISAGCGTDFQEVDMDSDGDVDGNDLVTIAIELAVNMDMGRLSLLAADFGISDCL